MAHALGDVRDLDVQIERFQAWQEEADEEVSRFLDRILTITGKRRAEARKNMLEPSTPPGTSVCCLRSRRCYASVRRRAESAQTNGKDQAGEPVTAAAPALISDRHRKWRKAAKRLDETSSPEAFHAVRKKGSGYATPLSFSLKSTVDRCRI